LTEIIEKINSFLLLVVRFLANKGHQKDNLHTYVANVKIILQLRI